MRRARVALASIACACAVLACAGAGVPSAPAIPIDVGRASADPRWEDAFDVMPELLVVVFPSALRSDRVYGPLLRRAIDLARERSRVVAETRALDAMEDADEVILGVRPDSPDPSGDMVVVVRGVRGDVDPAMLVDADGRPLWEPGPAGRVRELVRSEGLSPASSEAPRTVAPIPASLFELPGRTWVIASGSARERARTAFAGPDLRRRSRADLEMDLAVQEDEALAAVRIDGPSLVARVHALQPARAAQPAGALADVGRRLEGVTFELAAGAPAESPPVPAAAAGASTGNALPSDAGADTGDGGVRPPTVARVVTATLSYANADAASLAEATVRQVLDAIARKKPDGLAWLANGDVGVARAPPGTRVVVTAPLPPHLVAALLHARSARLPGFDEAPPP